MRPWLERQRDRSFLLLTLNYAIGQALYRAGWRRHKSGATHLSLSIDEGVEYIERVFADYLHYLGLPSSALKGKRVLEVGPGDNLGVALLFVAHGAKSVTCLDRFAADRDTQKSVHIYRRLTQRLRERGIDVADFDVVPPNVTLHSDTAIEDAVDLLAPASFDIIVSRAVMEHVYDLDAAWRAMDTLLAPGGVQLHKIDFRNHGFYQSLDPLYFLRVPSWLWKLVSLPDPTLNRRRASSYETLATDAGYDFRVDVTHLALSTEELPLGALRWPLEGLPDPHQRAAIARQREQFAMPFRELTDEDLLVAGIFLIAWKWAAAAGDGRSTSPGSI